MVEPAWAVAEIATSGSKREIVRRCLVNMVRLHHCWKRVMCALLIMSSEQIVCRLQSHADVKRTGTPLYQRNSRGPNAAPAKVHSINGNRERYDSDDRNREQAFQPFIAKDHPVPVRTWRTTQAD